MSERTTCPQCGGPAESFITSSVVLQGGTSYERTGTGGYPMMGYRTTADPARLARLESLLREIEWMGHSFDAGQHYVHCLVCQGIKGVTGHSPHCTLAALLGPADAS